MSRVFLSLLSMLLITNLSYAEMYKWVDEEGNVHYTQTKPNADTEVETIKPPPKVTPPPKPAEPKPEAEAAEAEQGETEDEASKQKNAEMEAENAEISKQNCDASKQRLTELNNAGSRIKYTDEDGNVAWASEEQVASRKAELEANVKKWCK